MDEQTTVVTAPRLSRLHSSLDGQAAVVSRVCQRITTVLHSDERGRLGTIAPHLLQLQLLAQEYPPPLEITIMSSPAGMNPYNTAPNPATHIDRLQYRYNHNFDYNPDRPVFENKKQTHAGLIGQHIAPWPSSSPPFLHQNGYICTG